MKNCFGRTQIASIELSEVFKRIRCLCTCCGGRALTYKSELDGKPKGQNSEEKTLVLVVLEKGRPKKVEG